MKKLVCMTVSCMFILFSATGAFAQTMSTVQTEDSGQQVSNVLHVQKHENSDGISKLTVDTSKSIKLTDTKRSNGEMATNSIYTFTDPVFNTTGTLTSSNTYDLYLFSTTQDRSAFLKINSDNINYIAMVCTVSNGTAYPTNFYTSANAGAYFTTSLPAGSYALYVFSNDGSIGDSYTLMWNGSNPANFTRIIKMNDNLTSCYLYYSNLKTIYLDGEDLASTAGWQRVFSLTTDSGYIYEEQNITDPVITGMSLGSYETVVHPTTTDNRTPKYTIPNALFISIGPGSKWQKYTSVYQNGGPLQSDPYDVRGLQTPRDIDSTDVSQYYYDYQDHDKHYHCFCLVYDLDKNSFLDFCSTLNGFYSSQSTANHEEVKTMSITETLF
ncbi:hypothetical protein [Caproicibacter fermentans]|uniref:Peptidase C-terminal archaeal/bacterial domain-containing protein n=1 Tax=Caproicibacter fermentans TaxID=2576756 RepID=A0A7G8T780_9FIRM|nr:hypothetical protein [Caproicibacter fermentans]QNK39471.1 hypothetical protein HCR03_12005 [Caproicibacter fermentans]